MGPTALFPSKLLLRVSSHRSLVSRLLLVVPPTPMRSVLVHAEARADFIQEEIARCRKVHLFCNTRLADTPENPFICLSRACAESALFSPNILQLSWRWSWQHGNKLVLRSSGKGKPRSVFRSAVHCRTGVSDEQRANQRLGGRVLQNATM